MTLVKVVSILLFILSSLEIKACPSDTLVVIFDRQHFNRGDSIEIEIYTEPYKKNPLPRTLHLWIDNVKTGQRWKYRYPFLEGRYKVALKINNSIPNGSYAFNFLLQDEFLAIKGKVINATEKDKSVNYLAVTKNKAPIIDDAALQPGNYFNINNLYFTDSVLFRFSPVQKKKSNDLHIAIEVPIDSVFVPEALETALVNIGGEEINKEELSKPLYVFSMVIKRDKETLEEVILRSKVKSHKEEFEAEHVSGLFNSDNSETFDFIDNNELLAYADIFSYLVVKIPGLKTEINTDNNQPVLFWRNEMAVIYVDEFEDQDFSPYALRMEDIQLIKIFRPGSRVGFEGQRGAIAIYTKRNENRKGNKLGNYSFYVKGYTHKNSEWK